MHRWYGISVDGHLVYLGEHGDIDGAYEADKHDCVWVFRPQEFKLWIDVFRHHERKANAR